MTLILSSCDFSEDRPRAVIREHLPKPAEECRILFVPNERANEETLKMDKYNRRLRQKGFSRGRIFVFDHTRPRDFEDLDFDVIYIGGGNTFLILQKLRDTGFDRVIAQRVRAGATYIGGSAGAHIASKSVSHLTRYDAPPEGFTDFSALGLWDGILVCHYGPEREAHYRELLRSGERVIPLRNDQTLLVTDEGETVC